MTRDRSDSPTRAGDRDESRGPVVQGTVAANVVERLAEATRRGANPAEPIAGFRCPSCAASDLLACGVFRQFLDENREFEVVLACRACGALATFAPRVTYRVERR